MILTSLKQFLFSLTHQSTAHIAVIKLCMNDVDIFLHFHAFLQADSGMGSFLTTTLTSLKNPTELPVVKITELNSMAEIKEDLTGHTCPQYKR